MAGVAVVVSATQGERTDRGLEGLCHAPCVGSLPAAPTVQRWPCIVRQIGVEPTLDGAGRDLQGLSLGGRLDGLEVNASRGARSNQRLDFGDDLGRELFLEPPFSPSVRARSAASRWSQSCSLISTNSRPRPRNARHSAICCRVSSTPHPGIIQVTVLPSTTAVNDPLGPCPSAPS